MEIYGNLDVLCGGAPGCAYKQHTTTDSRVVTAQIILRNNLPYHTNYRTTIITPATPVTTLTCTEMYVTAMHEVGHIYGLGDTAAVDSAGTVSSYGIWPSVMSLGVYSSYHHCRPTQLDIAAVKAIYQSR